MRFSQQSALPLMTTRSRLSSSPADHMLDDTTLIITAWRRPVYFQRVMDSWTHTRGFTDVHRVVIALAPSDAEKTQRDIIDAAIDFSGRDIEVLPDSPACASVNGPHRAIAEAASTVLADDPGCQFLIFSEEDTLISDDALEYLSWGRDAAAGRALMICAHNALGNGWQRHAPPDDNVSQSASRLGKSFSPWCWGVSREVWNGILEPDWDYECNKGPNGMEHGYDWQLQRITERSGLVLTPDAARSQNIGRYGGVYANPNEFSWTQAASFREHRDSMTYQLEDENGAV